MSLEGLLYIIIITQTYYYYYLVGDIGKTADSLRTRTRTRVDTHTDGRTDVRPASCTVLIIVVSTLYPITTVLHYYHAHSVDVLSVWMRE